MWAPCSGCIATSHEPGEVKNCKNCPYSPGRYKRLITCRSAQEGDESVYNVKIKAQLTAGTVKPSEFYRNPTASGGRGLLNVPGALRIPALG
jgi:hypothetical protein